MHGPAFDCGVFFATTIFSLSLGTITVVSVNIKETKHERNTAVLCLLLSIRDLRPIAPRQSLFAPTCKQEANVTKARYFAEREHVRNKMVEK